MHPLDAMNKSLTRLDIMKRKRGYHEQLNILRGIEKVSKNIMLNWDLDKLTSDEAFKALKRLLNTAERSENRVKARGLKKEYNNVIDVIINDMAEIKDIML